MMENSEYNSNHEEDVHGERGGAWSMQTRRKRNRRSTGGTFTENISTETVCNISKEAFISMSQDEKLVSLFDIMTSGFGSMNSKVHAIEDNVHALISVSVQSERRIKLLEYKSIDQEARSRRNNLIFRGFPEVLGNDDCDAIIRNFLSDRLDMQDVAIQRAHRLGSLRGAGQRRKSRPIIVCFRDYKDVQAILAEAHTLQGTDIGINRDYPDEIVKARSRLWADYKAEKPKYPRGKVFIGFPAKLVVDGEVVRDEFPDWQTIMKGSRNATSDSGKSTVPERGRGRGRIRGSSRFSVGGRSRGPGASRGIDHQSSNEFEMLSDKSESDDGDNRPHNPGSPDRAPSPVRPQGGATGSVSSSEGAVDEYSDAMRKLESAHSRMSQQSGTGTYRATLTDKTPSNINADAANSQD